MFAVLLLGIPTVLALKRVPYHRSHSHSRHRMSDEIDQAVMNALERRFNAPVVFSKQLLFGNGISEVLIANDELEAADTDDDNDSDPKNRLKGIQRVEPSELIRRRKGKVRNESTETDLDDETVEYDDDDDSFEIVDKFRFKIDADALREAIVKKTTLKGKQQMSSTQNDANLDGSESNENAVTFNQSLLDKLASGEAVIDDSGDSTIIRLVLDHDDFASMVDSQNSHGDSEDEDEEYMYSSVGTYIDKKEREERKKSLAYSALKMKEAESFIHRVIRTKDQEVKVFNKERFLEENKPDVEADNENDINQLTDSTSQSETDTDTVHNNNALNMKRIKSIKKKKDSQKLQKKLLPTQYLADMTSGIIFENVYGTAVIGLALAMSIFFFDFLSISVVSAFQTLFSFIVNKIPIFKGLRTKWMKSAKPLVLLSILFSNVFLHFIQKLRDGNRFAGIGFKEGEKKKYKSGLFRRKLTDLKSLFNPSD